MAIITRNARAHRFCQNPLAARQRTKNVSVLLAVLFFSFFSLPAASIDVNTRLSDEAKKRYLRYYAPLILKEAQETSAKPGLDWITNFDFDRDGEFGTNYNAWQTKVWIYATAPNDTGVANWKIRPTLYSAAIEFKNTKTNTKSLILLYHVYHALEEGSVHDWERVELRINNVDGTPGGGDEFVRYLVYTEHTIHKVLEKPGTSAFAPRTANGYHPLIWQARWIDDDKPDKNQLLRVTDNWNTLSTAVACASGNCPATVGTSGHGKQPVHYVFVPEDDPDQVAFWGAVAITDDNATALASGKSAAVQWPAVKRITYELQDLADIMVTHADIKRCTGVDPGTDLENGWKTWEYHWLAGNGRDILLEDPIKSEDGTVRVRASSDCINDAPVLFHRYSKGDLDDAQGYPQKHWFWGTYKMNGEGGKLDDAAYEGKAVVSGTTAGGPQKRICSAGYNDYWCQHDYYAHLGNTTNNDHGFWLKLGWHTSAEGGSDGRWIQLFPDTP